MDGVSQIFGSIGGASNPRPTSIPNTTEESLWIHGRHDPAWAQDGLRGPRLQTQAEHRGVFFRKEEQMTKAKESHVKATRRDGNYNQQKLQECTALLKACAKQKDLQQGCRIHADILQSRLLRNDIYVSTALINMYAKCGALVKAQEVLDEILVRDVVSWSALIAGYAQHGHVDEALKCFRRMKDEGLSPNAITFTCILQACASNGAIAKGEEIHAEVVSQGLLEKDIILGTALVDMYAKCGALTKAQELFDHLPAHDVVSWSVLIAGYVQHGQYDEALNCFESMQNKGLCPDVVTFSCILKACGNVGATEKGEEIHIEVIKQGLVKKNIMLGTALVDMYGRCGALAKAQEVFDELPVRNVFTWNVLIAGYAQHGHGDEALYYFEQMQEEGLSPDAITFTCCLKACGSIGAAEKGERIHTEAVRQGLFENSIILGTAVVDMYAKCGVLAKAQEVFNELLVHDVVSWSALIAGYAQHGHGVEALNCLKHMQEDGLFPDTVIFTCVLKACGIVGAAEKGEEIHAEVVRQGLVGKNAMLGNALVDMYVKCGALAKAREVFEELPNRDVVSWNALIAGYAQHGHGEDALTIFEWMQQEGVSPNSVTFIVLLNACNHSGLVDKGQKYFASMSSSYGIIPTLEHYVCMVDLFGRAGYLDKAIRVIEVMPPSDCHPLWFSLLSICQKWGNLMLGRVAFEHLVQLDEKDAIVYICMSNMYAAAGMRDEMGNVEAMMIKNEVQKLPSLCN